MILKIVSKSGAKIMPTLRDESREMKKLTWI
jgi:hypothetical protein